MNPRTNGDCRAVMAVATLLVLAGCGTISHPSPCDLELILRSDKPSWKSGDTFTGTLTFENKTRRPIDVWFPTLGQYHVVFYDSTGAARLERFDGSICLAVSHLTLDPLGLRVDTLEYPLVYYADTIPYPLPPGPYRIRAWIEHFEDINSETNIRIDSPSVHSVTN